jgi:hypothetical protein
MNSSEFSIRNLYSSKLTPKNDLLLNELQHRLLTGGNLSIYGPVNTGKSTMLELLAQRNSDNKAVVKLDFLDQMFIFEKSTIHMALDKVGVKAKPDSRIQSIQLLQEQVDKPILLLADHLTIPIFPEDIQTLTKSSIAMNWLSQQLLDFKLLAESKDIALCVALDEISPDFNLVNFLISNLPNGKPVLDRLQPIILYNQHPYYRDHLMDEVLDFLNQFDIDLPEKVSTVIKDRNRIGKVLGDIENTLA